MAAPQALSVDHAESTLFAHLNDEFRAGQRVSGVVHEWQIKLVGINVPVGVNVLGRTGTAAGDDRNIVQAVRASCLTADADFYMVTHL